MPGVRKPWREGFIIKKDEVFTSVESAIQHCLGCWDPRAGQALTLRYVSYAQCLVKGKRPFSLCIQTERHEEKGCWEKNKLQRKKRSRD